MWSGSWYADAAPLRRGSLYCHHHRVRCAGLTCTGARCSVTSSCEHAHAEPLRQGGRFCAHHCDTAGSQAATAAPDDSNESDTFSMALGRAEELGLFDESSESERESEAEPKKKGPRAHTTAELAAAERAKRECLARVEQDALIDREHEPPRPSHIPPPPKRRRADKPEESEAGAESERDSGEESEQEWSDDEHYNVEGLSWDE